MDNSTLSQVLLLRVQRWRLRCRRALPGAPRHPRSGLRPRGGERQMLRRETNGHSGFMITQVKSSTAEVGFAKPSD